jgi:hypothetical protein
MTRRESTAGVLLLLASAAAPTGLTGQDRLFQGSRSFPIDSSANVLALVDFDLDGSLDVAALGSATLSVLLSDSGETFLAPAVYRPGTGPVALAARDLDNDADPDVIIADSGSSTITVLLNAGDGSLAPAPSVRVGLGPRAVALDDFNADGDVDLVSTNLGDRTLDILLGDGSGGFSRGEGLPVGDNPHSIVSGDFNGDARADVVVAHTGAVSWFQGLGNGTFASPVPTMVFPDPRVLRAADFIGDGKPDLAVITDPGGSSPQEGRTILALEGLGGGRFREELLDTVSSGRVQDLGGLEIADFDADGTRDLLVLDSSGAAESLLRTYRGDGAGRFEKGKPIFLGAVVASVAAGGLNADELLDVLAGPAGSPEVLVFDGIAPGRIAARTLVALESGPRGLAALDIDADASPDLVAYSSDAIHAVKRQAGGFEPVIRTPFAGSAFLDMAPGDFDGDGLEDVALADLGLNEARLAFFEGGAVSARTRGHPLRGLPSQLAAADLDGDGLSDLIASDGVETALVIIFRPADDGSAAITLDAGSNQTAIAVSDFDADGALDVAACGRGGIRLFLGDGARGFPRTLAVDGLASAPELRAADLDGDAYPDLAGVARSKLVIIQSPASSPRSMTLDLGVEVRPLEVADVNADGSQDLVTASWSTVVVARGEPGGNLVFREPEAYGVGQSPRAIVLHDIDGDGAMDVATADYASRSLSLVHGAGPRGGLFRRGDADTTGVVDLSDGIAILSALFLGAGPLACPDAGDADDDGVLGITDAIAVLLHLFAGGPEPPSPGPGGCGPDPSADALEACSAACR